MSAVANGIEIWPISQLPVVAVDDESFRNVIIDGLNGHLFDTKKEYKKYVKSFIDEPSKLQQFSKQARINADTYSSKYFAERVLDVYRLAINGETSEEKNSVSIVLKYSIENFSFL